MLTVSDEFRAGSSDPTLPLSDGALDENLGVPIAIVLTKADQVDDKRALSPTQVDYVQQVVRTIALRYGAAVFSVSQSAPVHSVRDYIKTRLFSRPASTTASAVDAATLAVPSGWDSWSQIRVANESFDCRRTIDAWLAGPSAFAQAYTASIPDPRTAAAAEAGERITLPDTQEFLAQLGEQGGVAEREPPAAASGHTSVGPSVDASSLAMPSVSKALAEQQRDMPEHSSHASPARAPSTHGTPRRERLAPGQSPSLTTPKQNEVLHSFFQSRASILTSAQEARHTRHARNTGHAKRASVTS